MFLPFLVLGVAVVMMAWEIARPCRPWSQELEPLCP